MNVNKTVMQSCVEIIRMKQFYGNILQQMSKIFGSGDRFCVDTMGVGKLKDEFLIKFYINEDWVKLLFERASDENVAFKWLNTAIEHEILHCIFNHLTITFSDKIRGNVAMDCAVNSYFDKSDLPDGCVFPQDYGLEEKKDCYWYYKKLKDNKKYNDLKEKKGFGRNSHVMWDSIKDDPLMKEFLKDMISKAEKACGKDYGDIPGDIISKLDDLLKKQKAIVPWNKALRLFVATASESNLDYTMKRVSKRYGTRPGTKKEDVLNLAVGVDVSGSISDRDLVVFFNEIRWIWKNGAEVTVYECDTQIHSKYKFKGKFTGEVHGRGGTDLEPVLKECEKKYDGLIFFTDFYAPKIEKRYNIPILWVLNNDMDESNFPYKWGKHIKIETYDKE